MKGPLISILSFLYILSSYTGHAAVSCETVQAKSGACVMFALGRAPKPAPSCCTGLQQLAQSIRSLEDKKAICRCLKAGAKSFGGLQDRFLSHIPKACNIQVGFPVSVNIDCVLHVVESTDLDRFAGSYNKRRRINLSYLIAEVYVLWAGIVHVIFSLLWNNKIINHLLYDYIEQ